MRELFNPRTYEDLLFAFKFWRAAALVAAAFLTWALLLLILWNR